MKPSLRFKVFRRDNFRCQYCGQTPPTVILEVDHIVPRAHGGSDELLNLLTSCQECNRGKGARSLQDKVQPLAESIAAEQERRAQVEAYNRALKALGRKQDRDWRSASDAIVNMHGKDPSCNILAGEWSAATRRFLDRLPSEAVIDAARITQRHFGELDLGDNSLKYFCGVCWHKINGTPEADRRRRAARR